jgi:HPt (histidine-containing phosphotransfer) domain-containing protein
MDSNDGAGRVRQQVSQLGEKFLRRTQAEATVLGDLCERIQAGDLTVLPQLEAMAHKIHGSGAMFGFPAVSECAGEIEHLAEHLMTVEGAADVHSGNTLQRLQNCISQLAQAAEVNSLPAAGSPPPTWAG